MLVSKKWLNHFVKVDDIDAVELADILTNAGLEVEHVTKSVEATNLVIGQVIACENHPDSDHLHVTKVDIQSEILDIVCGAPNVETNQKVIVAKVGAKLPEIEIKKAKVRGVESNGMICSLLELGIDAQSLPVDSPSHHGIEVLGEEAIIGSDPLVYLGLDDTILDVSQTPNRSDFLAMSSIGKEVSALLNRPYIEQPIIENTLDGLKSNFTLELKTPNCPTFIAKEIGKVVIKESPQWIQQALISSGMHPINNIVDISNLVMLETGQPTHFYDRNFFSQPNITVVEDFQGDVVALDEETYTLQIGDTVITSALEPIGIAGIKGLGNSVINENTTGIVIEIASFDALKIRNTARRLGLSSDAQARYVKPMDPNAPLKALKRILYLLKEYASAEDFYESIVVGDLSEQPLPEVSVSVEKVNGLLGTHLSLETIVDVFERLHFNPVVVDQLITCTIPSYRRDIAIAEDLIEEVIRVVGYDVIESNLPQMPLTLGSLNEEQHLIRKTEEVLMGLGGQQVVTYTLVSKDMTENVLGLENPLNLLSPLSDKREFIRNNITTSLVATLKYNLARNNENNLYYELSQVYAKDQNQWRLGLVGSGELVSASANATAQVLDFYRLKGIVEVVLEELGIQRQRLSYEVNTLDIDTYHPYRSAKVFIDKKFVGLLGELHPQHKVSHGVLCELNFSFIINMKKAKTKYKPLNKYPRVKRDLAILVDKSVSNEKLVELIKKAGRPYLVSCELFDVYQKDVNDLQHSLAYSLVFESNEKTLVDSDVTDAITKIINSLSEQVSATLR